MEAREALCRGRMAQIGLAIQNYYNANGSFPPACVRDRAGNPLHSWRVLILPYCELEDVYRRYDFKEAWNSPKNAALANEVSERVTPLFRCPNDRSAQKDWTTFLALTTNEKGDPDRLVVMRGAATSTNPVIIDIHGSGIHWTDPRDLPVDTARAGLVRHNADSGVVNFLTSDAQVWSLTESQLTLRNSESDIIEWMILSRPSVR